MEAKRRLTKSEIRRRKEKTISFIILAIVSLIWILPLIYMVGTSFKSDADLVMHPEKFFPTSLNNWTLKHYEGFIIRDGQLDNMPKWMWNSIWSTGVTVLLTIIIDAITAYAVVFIDFKGKKTFIKFLLLWMAVPGVIGTSASYIYFAQVRNAMNTAFEAANTQANVREALNYMYIYCWLIIPGVTGIFNMLLMRNFFLTIPMDIIESARSDGANNKKIFFKIVMPLAKSTVMLIVLFTFTGAWNNLQFPQLLLSGEKTGWNTITVALTGYTGAGAWSAKGVSMATSVFALIPIIIVFLITQNKMIDGLASTGVKR